MTKRRCRGLLCAAALLATTHPLPAPVFDVPDTPAPKQKARPSPSPAPKAKPKRTAEPAPQPVSRAAVPGRRSRFAGTWVGTMPTIPWGNVAVELKVDASETTMVKLWAGDGLSNAKAQIIGDTIQATFPALEGKWSITPEGNGATARVRLQALANDQTVVFHRAIGESGAARATK